MANRTIQDYLSSGESTEHKIGGTDAKHNTVIRGDFGILEMSNSADVVLALTTTYQKVGMVDLTNINTINGHVSYANDTITINTTSPYKLRASGTVELANNSEVTFAYYKNGVIVPKIYPIFVGRGANKPVLIADFSTLQLNNTDTIEIYARVDVDTSVTVKSLGLSIEKTI